MPDGTFEPLPPEDEDIIGLLQDRDGRLTEVVLRDGQRFRVLNIAWGYDAGDSLAHVTTNISPSLPGEAIDFFSTEDVAEISDPRPGTS